MLDLNPPFRAVDRRDDYLPLEDMGLIGDGNTAALVGLDGTISWLCVPRFDSEPVFCGLLGSPNGGHFTVAPEEIVEARQTYEPDTAVLHTELRSRSGLVRLTDALALRPGADLCSFWLVDNLARQGKLDKAAELYASLCARASPLGLLPEQIDPTTGGFIGNFPQAFSHIGVIASGVTLQRAGAPT